MTISSNNNTAESLNETYCVTMLWLTGWSLPDSVFDRLRELMPEYDHVSVLYYDSNTLEEMLLSVEIAVRNRPMHGPLLVAGWSLGALLALRLAAKGFVDGLMLFGATARFIRSKEENALGWGDGYVRGMIRGIAKDREAAENNFRKLLFTESEQDSGFPNCLSPIGSWSTASLISGLQILRTVECLSQLSTIACPVLLIHGAEDNICYYDAVMELKDQLPTAKLVTIPACGHVPFLAREMLIAEEWRRWWHAQGQK